MKSVLVSGAGIAGPSLAYWLARRGLRCTVVERAPALRVGGQAVDFRGPVHREMLERMEMWNPIHAHRTAPGELVLLARDGSPLATLPPLFMAGDVEIVRGDLCKLLYERTRDSVEYRFDEHVTAIADRRDGVDVTFASGRQETFDLVVGADGLHSGVRLLAFGDERGLLRHHGYRIASFALPDVRGLLQRGTAVYSVPGRAVSLSATGREGEGRALLVYTGEALGPDRRDVEAQKRSIRQTYEGVGWEVPRVLEALDVATDLYVDAIATVHIDHYFKGRVALLGDAAYGGTLGGQGSPLAMVGAHVLAGEIARGGDLSAALARYEAQMRPYATQCQKGAMNAGMFFAPRTQMGLALRNAFYGILSTRFFRGALEWLVTDAATNFVLPQYT